MSAHISGQACETCVKGGATWPYLHEFTHPSPHASRCIARFLRRLQHQRLHCGSTPPTPMVPLQHSLRRLYVPAQLRSEQVYLPVPICPCKEISTQPTLAALAAAHVPPESPTADEYSAGTCAAALQLSPSSRRPKIVAKPRFPAVTGIISRPRLQ